MIDPQDVQAMEDAKPALRTLIAVVLYLRFGSFPARVADAEKDVKGAYGVADIFLDQLTKDYTS